MVGGGTLPEDLQTLQPKPVSTTSIGTLSLGIKSINMFRLSGSKL